MDLKENAKACLIVMIDAGILDSSQASQLLSLDLLQQLQFAERTLQQTSTADARHVHSLRNFIWASYLLCQYVVRSYSSNYRKYH